MTERVKKYLFDILYAIDVIEDFLGEMNFLEYEADLKTKSAVERQLAIIGEAVNNLIKENIDFELANAREIVNFRNRIIHAYDNIDDTIVWAIKSNHLPVLKIEIELLMTNNSTN